MSTLGTKLPDLEHALHARPESADGRPENDEVRRAWALALAQTVAFVAPERHLAVASDSSLEAWHKGDARLTGGADGRAAEAGVGQGKSTESASGSSSSPSADKLVTEVDAGHLGRIGVTVGRSEGGLSIVIIADNPYSHSLLELERSALLASLRSGGLNVTSVSVASSAKPGTSLALVRTDSKTESKTENHVRYPSSKIRAYQSQSDDDEDDGEPNLDLIG